MPDSAWGTPSTDKPHAWDIIFDIVRRAADAWPKLCQLLPREETWEICAEMVKRYLAMPPKYVQAYYSCENNDTILKLSTEPVSKICLNILRESQFQNQPL